jgi:ATP-dependent Clp protease ATP-binding subunit ClpB
MEVVRSAFRPEFLNRLDDILLFSRLQRRDMGTIVGIQMKNLLDILEHKKINITLDKKAEDWLAEKGYDPVYGARPLKRTIQTHLQNVLAMMILEGKIKEGDHVKVSTDKNGLKIAT